MPASQLGLMQRRGGAAATSSTTPALSGAQQHPVPVQQQRRHTSAGVASSRRARLHVCAVAAPEAPATPKLKESMSPSVRPTKEGRYGK